jgi:hypothetical protein
VDDSGDELDTSPEQEKEDALDRRVELFFFDSQFGIVPPPPGENSKAGDKQYRKWRQRAELQEEISPLPIVRGERYAVRLLDLRGKPMEATSGIAFSVTVDRTKVASGVAFDAWAVFRLPPLSTPIVDLVWGPVDSKLRFGRRVDLTSARPAEGSLSASRLGALGFPTRDDGDTTDAARGYQSLYELSDAETAVIEHMDAVFAAKFEAPHPEAEDNEEVPEEVEPTELPDDGPDEGLDGAGGTDPDSEDEEA